MGDDADDGPDAKEATGFSDEPREEDQDHAEDEHDNDEDERDDDELSVDDAIFAIELSSRGDGEDYAITPETVLRNVQDAWELFPDEVRDRFTPEEVAAAMMATDPIRDVWPYCIGAAQRSFPHHADALAQLRLAVTMTDRPRCELDTTWGVVTVDSGLWGAICRAAKLMDVIDRSPELTDERLLDIGRLDKLYSQIPRWHGLFAVEFQIAPLSDKVVSPASCASVGALAFFILHEIVHHLQRLDGDNERYAQTELEHQADQAAQHLLRDLGLTQQHETVSGGSTDASVTVMYLGFMADNEFLRTALEVAAFIMRRYEEACFLEPPATHLRWFVRRDELLSRLRSDPPGPAQQSAISLLHQAVTRAQRCNRAADWDSLESLFERNTDIATRPSDEALEAMGSLETLDELFHLPTYDLLVKLAEERIGRPFFAGTTGEERDAVLTQVRRQLREEFPATADSAVSRDRGVLFTDIVSASRMSTLLRAVRARYAAIHLGLAPSEAQWN